MMVTGDIRYHGAIDAQSSQISLIDAGHFGLEKFAIRLMRDKFEDEISKLGWNIDLCPYNEEENPFTDICFEKPGGMIN
jgi:putative NIF3 family GTP cyclohydrolase 1 type 2